MSFDIKSKVKKTLIKAINLHISVQKRHFNQLISYPHRACLGVRCTSPNEHGTILPISTLKSDLQIPSKLHSNSIINQVHSNIL